MLATVWQVVDVTTKGRQQQHSHIVTGRAPPRPRASLSRADLLRSSFSLAIRAVILSSI